MQAMAIDEILRAQSESLQALDRCRCSFNLTAVARCGQGGKQSSR